MWLILTVIMWFSCDTAKHEVRGQKSMTGGSFLQSENKSDPQRKSEIFRKLNLEVAFQEKGGLWFLSGFTVEQDRLLLSSEEQSCFCLAFNWLFSWSSEGWGRLFFFFLWGGCTRVKLRASVRKNQWRKCSDSVLKYESQSCFYNTSLCISIDYSETYLILLLKLSLINMYIRFITSVQLSSCIYSNTASCVLNFIF